MSASPTFPASSRSFEPRRAALGVDLADIFRPKPQLHALRVGQTDICVAKPRLHAHVGLTDTKRVKLRLEAGNVGKTDMETSTL